ncbi:PA14 domain protein [Colletotrichum sp. SAR 10_86]|nr:PA14 domain protein [Colletotrichum sp. SAR 10_65]KAI8232078.1 PA14 domain protein [Colletotrichum sp. SAR 10_86]
MCAEALSMMEQLLTVSEKRDAEALALQRARQDAEMQDMLLGRKSLGYEELDLTLRSLQIQRKSNVS